MVQHLEQEMELNRLANLESTPFTGIYNVKPASNTNQERVPNATRPCFGCGHPGHLLRRNCRKKIEIKEPKNPSTQTYLTPVKHVSKRAMKPKTATVEQIGQIAQHGGRNSN